MQFSFSSKPFLSLRAHTGRVWRLAVSILLVNMLLCAGAQARDLHVQGILLPLWDADLIAQSTGFDNFALTDELEEDYYVPMDLTLEDVVTLYNALTVDKLKMHLPARYQHEKIEELRYNFGVSTHGGVRLNVRYQF